MKAIFFIVYLNDALHVDNLLYFFETLFVWSDLVISCCLFLSERWQVARSFTRCSDGSYQSRATRKSNAGKPSGSPELSAAMESPQRVRHAERARTPAISTTGEQFCL